MNSETKLVAGLIAGVMFLLLLALYTYTSGRVRKPAAWKYTTQMDEATKLVETKKYPEAEAILLPLRRVRDAPSPVFFLLALCSQRQGRLAEAAGYWSLHQRYYPTEPAGYVGGAQLLIQQNRRKEAHALLAKAATKVSHKASLTKVLADVAMADQDWESAVRLWAQARTEAPGLAEAYVKGHDALIAAGRPEEAAELLADAAMRFPSDKLVRAAVEQAAQG
jgi:predicted Zn-dependent protease